jgi:ADP-heptose:LPS heptosyltransferase
MKLQTQRLIDRWIGQLLCAAVSGWAKLARRGAPRPAKHILVIMLSEMGSMVLAGPMFALIRQRFPEATIHVLQLKKNQQVSTLLRIAQPEHMHALDDSSLIGLLSSLWRVTRALRALPVDAVIDCELFSRISALMAYASGAPQLVGFTPHTQEGLYRGSFMTHAIPYNPYRHISQQFVALVDALQDTRAAPTLPRTKWSLLQTLPEDSGMRVDFEAGELETFKARLLRDFPQIDQTKLTLVYASGGILPERAWPQAHYVELVRGLCAAGHAVGLIGLPEDTPLAKSIQAQIAGASSLCIDLTGYTKSIRELLMLFHQGSLLVTNDGGPGHFASLTPIRTFMFFGPETSRLYGPLSRRTTVFDLQIACSPCLSAYNHRQTFCDGDNQCLKRIEPSQVLRMALQELTTESPAP